MSFNTEKELEDQKNTFGKDCKNGDWPGRINNSYEPDIFTDLPHKYDSTVDIVKNGTTTPSNENGTLKKPDDDIKTTWIRFYILGVFSCFALLQNVVWGPFGPILASAQFVYGWEDDVIAIFQCLGPAGTFFFMFPITWLDEKYGPRKGLLVGALCLVVGTGFRCFSTSNETYTILAILAGALTGIAGCNCLALPPMISAIWFPPEERITSTAVGSLAAQVGLAGMWLAPLIVRSPTVQPINSTISLMNSTVSKDDFMDLNGTLTKDDIKGDIMELMYIEFGVTVALFLVILAYFPDTPKHPPSASSKVERSNYFASMKATAKNRDYLIVLLVYSFSFGVPVNWISVMNFSLECINIDQNHSMWIGIAACLVPTVSAFIVARITDTLHGYMKITIIVLLFLSSLCFLWLLLLITEVITPSLTQVFIAIVGGYTLEYATVPILIELGVELAYPCSEAVVGSSLGAGFNLLSMLFLLFFVIPTKCYYWAGYVLVACTFTTILPLIFVKETHKRSAIDIK